MKLINTLYSVLLENYSVLLIQVSWATGGWSAPSPTSMKPGEWGNSRWSTDLVTSYWLLVNCR
jgi:hypothetical protein